ncbi:MAG: FHA domain-containing protein [Chitinophagales bacterium]
MKKKLVAIFFFYFSYIITSLSQISYKITEKEVNFEEFPQVSFKLWSRAITSIDTNKINLKEDKVEIKTATYKLTRDTSKKALKNKILFILIENHYLQKGVSERSFFKNILTTGLYGKIKHGDKVFIGTFDWYRSNKYLFLLNNSPLDDENQIISLINNISSPAPLQNKQVGADIYFALDETLKFLSQLKDSLPKNILLLSDDFPNIAGQKTVDEIRTESIKSDIPIYAIGYNVGADRYSQITQNEICQPTNGVYFSSKTNDRNVCSKKIAEFVDIMNINSLGKTYLVTFKSKQKKAGQNIVISLEENEKKLVESTIRYPFNLFQWIISNIILSIIILLSFLILAFGIYKSIQKSKRLKLQAAIEAQEKQLEIKNAANEIQQLKQHHQSQQQSNDQKFRDHKKQLEEEAKLEKLRLLMKAKSLIPRVNYDYNGQKGQFYIDTPRFKIGRDEKTNSFHISAPSLSRNHAEIIFNENGQFIINDLNSTNGVIINSKKENSIVLKHGDILKLGDVILKINL